MPTARWRALAVDDVTYIRGWDKGVKFLADAGLLERTALIVTGSDTAILREARMRFPGRRGPSDTVDFHLYPLTFPEVIRLRQTFSDADTHRLRKADRPPVALIDRLFAAFSEYLIHGGYLVAVNDLAATGRIRPATFAMYSDWIRGDIIKGGRNETYLREIVGAILSRYGGQVSWNALAGALSIDHPRTVSDYVDRLVSMEAAFILPALREDRLCEAPKKARKIFFADPFIYHALNAWIDPRTDPYSEQVAPLIADPPSVSPLVESVAAAHYRRFYKTYYIKARGEVDIAYVQGRRFWPVEVKWTGQLRPKSLNRIVSYPNGLILTRSEAPGAIAGVPTVPLPLQLLRLETSASPG